jgi:hypothetical protein
LQTVVQVLAQALVVVPAVTPVSHVVSSRVRT